MLNWRKKPIRIEGMIGHQIFVELCRTFDFLTHYRARFLGWMCFDFFEAQIIHSCHPSFHGLTGAVLLRVGGVSQNSGERRLETGVDNQIFARVIFCGGGERSVLSHVRLDSKRLYVARCVYVSLAGKVTKCSMSIWAGSRTSLRVQKHNIKVMKADSQTNCIFT